MPTNFVSIVDYAPRPNKPPPVIGKGDIDLFLLLQDFPYLSLPFIGELLGRKKHVRIENGEPRERYETLSDRLARLRHDGGYLRCPIESWPRQGAKKRHAVYALTTKGKLALKECGLYLPTYRLGNDFAHAFGSCVVPASFKLGVLANAQLRFIDAKEIIAHGACPAMTRDAQEPFSIPVSFTHNRHTIETTKEHDWAPFGIGYKHDKGERKIFFPGIEFDRDSEPLEASDMARSSLTRHLLMILALLDGGYKRQFGLPAVFVPIVTIGEVRMRSIMKLLLKLTDGKGSKHILFKHIPDFASYENFPPATGHMLTEPWERAGYEPLDILEVLGPKEKTAS